MDGNYPAPFSHMSRKVLAFDSVFTPILMKSIIDDIFLFVAEHADYIDDELITHIGNHIECALNDIREKNPYKAHEDIISIETYILRPRFPEALSLIDTEQYRIRERGNPESYLILSLPEDVLGSGTSGYLM